MKNQLIKNVLCATVLSASFIASNAQSFDDLSKVISGSIDDAEIITEAYLSPFLTGIANATSGGWYNTAKVHKPLGFELTFVTNAAFIPDVEKTFDVNELGLQELSVTSASSISPTISAKKSVETASVGPNDVGLNLDLDLPKGLGVFAVPMMTPQLGIGLIKGTDLFVRYMPTISVNAIDLEMGSWGIGVRHSIKQWIPVLEKVPVFHLSVFGGYTKFFATSALNVTPESIDPNIPSTVSATEFENQELQLTASSLTGNVLVSANLPVVCFYGGVGFVNNSSDFTLAGKYPILGVTGFTASDENPISASGEGGFIPRASIGMRIKMAIVTLQGEYVRSEYNMATFGLGITFR